MGQGKVDIQFISVFKMMGPNPALRGVTTVFESNQMHGLIGPEGAGKTTIFRHIVGLLRQDSGQIQYNQGEFNKPLAMIRSQIAYMPQQQSLYADLSIDEHLLFFKEMYNLSESEFLVKRDRLLDITRLKKFCDRPAGKLSGGMYKKLGLMCALMSSPQILLLDEPTNGVDPISRREFWDLLYQLRDDKILIIVATAYMDEAERCSKVHLLHEGQLIGSGNPRELLEKNHVHSFDEYFLKYQGEVPQRGTI